MRKIIIGLTCCVSLWFVEKIYAADLIFQDANYFSGTTSASANVVTQVGTVNANHIYRIDNALCVINKSLKLGVGTSSAMVVLVRNDGVLTQSSPRFPVFISGLAGTVSLYVASGYASVYYIIPYADFTTQ